MNCSLHFNANNALTPMSQSKTRIKSKLEAGSTADFLLDAAEELFAKKGIENVSIRQIVIASGHGNLSGAHYHFGTREVLIRKVLERRMLIIDSIRHEVLDKLVAEKRDNDLADIIGSTVHVLEAVVRNYEWGVNYVLVIAQALFNPRVHLLATIGPEAISGLKRTSEMAHHLLPNLSKDILDERFRMVRFNVVVEVARWFQENEVLTRKTQKSFDAMLENVSAFATAGLAAPVKS